MASIFTKILVGELPGKILYENDSVFAIKTIEPEDTTHILVIPKEEIASINDISNDNKNIIGNMTLMASQIAKDLGITDGYKLVLNIGDYGEIPHIHMHLISSRG